MHTPAFVTSAALVAAILTVPVARADMAAFRRLLRSNSFRWGAGVVVADPPVFGRVSVRAGRKVAARLSVLAAVVAAVLAGFVVVPAPALATAVDVFVSPMGSGSGCTQAAPCSVWQAQTKVEGLTSGMSSDIHVELAGGVYDLASQPGSRGLSFSPKDSGQNGHRVVWEAADAADPPVLSGGVAVTGWKQTSTPGIWSAPAPVPGLRTRQLYADGVRIPRATGASPVTLTPTPTGFTASSPVLASWRNPQDIEMVFDGGDGAWTQPRCDVQSISGTTITMRQPCWDNARLQLPSGTVETNSADWDNAWGGFPGVSASPTRLENAFELLTPGHWYLDQASNTVYYDARSGDDVGSMSFVAPVSQHLITDTGQPDAALANVTFQGISFEYATWMQPSSDEGFAEIQANATVTGSSGSPGGASTQGLCNFVSPAGSCPFAAWTREPAAVDLRGTRNVTFDGDTFEHLGGAGLGIFHGAAGDLIQGNEVTDVSGDGIELGAPDEAQAPTLIPTGDTISDNWVHNTGAEYNGAVGILGFYARNSVITHNQVNDTPYSGISFGWGGWHTNADTPGNNQANLNQDNQISNNLIYHVMQIRADGAPIYTNGSLDHIDTGTAAQGISHGLLESGNVTFANGHTSNAFYSDEGSSYVTLRGNVQYLDPGAFNGGCSTTGHFLIENNYYEGRLNGYGCDHVGSDFVLGTGSAANVKIDDNPAPGQVPDSILSAAGLEPAYASLTAAHAPVVAAVSPLSSSRQVLISGSGFTPTASVTVGGTAASKVNYLSSNYLIATFTSAPPIGYLQVTTAAGSSAISPGTFVFDPTQDLALHQAAAQSSTYPQTGGITPVASLAVDGNTSGSFFDGSISHTNLDTNAWWHVDLGASHPVGTIAIWNRTDCCADRLSDYWVFVSNSPFDTSLTPAQQAAQPGVFSSHQITQAGTPTLISLPAGTTGRYVMVQESGTQYLALAEVEIFKSRSLNSAIVESAWSAAPSLLTVGSQVLRPNALWI